MRFRVLGPVDAVAADGTVLPVGGPKQRTMLATLIAAAGRVVPTDRLLQAMYGEDASSNSRATLHTYVSTLRRTLGDVVVRHGDGYCLQFAEATVDAVEFEVACRLATALSTIPTAWPTGCATRCRCGAAIPYADVEAHGALDGEITRLNELRLAAIEARIDADMRAGRHREVIAELDALTVEHPFRENLRAMHMLALYRCGRQAEALRAFGRTRDRARRGPGDRPVAAAAGDGAADPRTGRARCCVGVGADRATPSGRRGRRGRGWPGRTDAGGRRSPVGMPTLATGRRALGRHDLAPQGTAGYAVFAEPIHAVRAARDGDRRDDPGGHRLRRPGVRRRRAGRAAAGARRPAGRRRQPRTGRCARRRRTRR